MSILFLGGRNTPPLPRRPAELRLSAFQYGYYITRCTYCASGGNLMLLNIQTKIMKTSKIKLPQYEPIPCWYELFMKNDYILGIRVHRQSLSEIVVDTWDTAPGIEHLVKKFKLEKFTSPHEGSWGFQDVLLLGESDHPDWIVWEFNLPKIKSTEGLDESSPKDIVALRASLYILFSLGLRFMKNETNWPTSQLIVVGNIELPDIEWRNSGSLGAILTPATISWISKQPHNCHNKDMVEAMKKAHEFMWTGASRNERFGAMTRGRYIFLDVPGDACGLGPDSYGDDTKNDGYNIGPHNVDSSLQQFTLLVGLAKLHDLIRADGF